VTFRPLPLAHVHRLLEPGPVVLLTTAREERANVMAMSWHTMMEFDPPHGPRRVHGRRAHAAAAL
jgi:hypothetical protein